MVCSPITSYHLFTGTCAVNRVECLPWRSFNDVHQYGLVLGIQGLYSEVIWIFHSIVYHRFQWIVYQCFSPKFTTFNSSVAVAHFSCRCFASKSMANKVTSMQQIRLLIQLLEKGVSLRTIAAELKLSRQSVTEYAKRLKCRFRSMVSPLLHVKRYLVI